MIVIDDFFQIRDWHRHTPNFFNARPLLFFVLVLRFQAFLILNEFLLKSEVVFYPLLAEKSQSALGAWRDCGELIRLAGTLLLLFPASTLWSRLLFALLLFLPAFALFFSLLGRLARHLTPSAWHTWLISHIIN